MRHGTRALPGWLASVAALAGLAACSDNTLTSADLGAVAVVTGDFDSVENVLIDLGIAFTRVDGYLAGPAYTLVEPYDWTTLSPEVEDLFATDTALDAYDVIFLDCGMRGAAVHVYNDASTPDNQFADDPAAIANLKEYVEFGGQLYVSDRAWELVERAFPDMIDFLGDDAVLGAAEKGELSTVVGRVLDEELLEVLGLPEGSDEINVVFNNSEWAVMASAQAEVLIEGDVTWRDPGTGASVEARGVPLLVTFDVGERGGKVVYTSFHSDAQTADDVTRIIEYLVLGFRQEGV